MTEKENRKKDGRRKCSEIHWLIFIEVEKAFALAREVCQGHRGSDIGPQGLNAIENAWKVLRDRLSETLPTAMEPRDSFITPLRTAVVQINTNKAEALEDYESNQKERAREVELKKGGRTKW